MLQITRQSPEQLIVRQNRLSVGRLSRELFITGLGLVFLTVSGPAKLECQRVEAAQVRCQLSYPGWLGMGVWNRQSIDDLQRVELLQVEDDGVFYDILLQTSEGEMSLRPYKTSGLDNTLESIDRIQAFLSDPNASHLTVTQWDWLQWFGLIPGLVFFLAGLQSLYSSLLSTRSKTIESYAIDESRRTLTYQYGGLLRRRQSVYPMFDIQRVFVDIHPQTGGWLFLELQTGELFCLNDPNHSANPYHLQWTDGATLRTIAQQISDRVRRPWQITLGFGPTWLQKQATQKSSARLALRLLDSISQPSSLWTFDRTGGRVIHQQTHSLKTYALQGIVDVQTTPVGDPVERKDSEGTTCYDVDYEVTLKMTNGNRVTVQKFYSLEYKYRWRPEKGEKSKAQQQAEAIAQPLRDYLKGKSP
jgi:hypothetical protein